MEISKSTSPLHSEQATAHPSNILPKPKIPLTDPSKIALQYIGGWTIAPHAAAAKHEGACLTGRATKKSALSRPKPSFNDIKILLKVISEQMYSSRFSSVGIYMDADDIEASKPDLYLDSNSYFDQFMAWLEKNEQRLLVSQLDFSDTEIEVFPDIAKFFPNLES